MNRRRRCVIHRPLIRPLIFVLVGSLSALASSEAASKQATDKAASRQAQEKAARKACLAGDYSQGVDLLADLFVETKDANYVFNQGRCFEQNRRYEDAIARFQEYLRAAGPRVHPEEKEAAEQHIKSCKDLLAQERESVAAQTVPQPLVPPVSPPASAPAEQPPAHVAQPASPTASLSTGRGLRIGGIVVASAGGAALLGGVLLNLQANSLIKDMEGRTDGYSAGKKSDSETYRALSWVGYGVGAACVVTGAVLYGIGLRARSKSASVSSADVALVPTAGMGQVGASVIGAF